MTPVCVSYAISIRCSITLHILNALMPPLTPSTTRTNTALMNDMDADIVKCIPCTKAMLGLPLLQVFDTQYPQYEQVGVVCCLAWCGAAVCVAAAEVSNKTGATCLLIAAWPTLQPTLSPLTKQSRCLCPPGLGHCICPQILHPQPPLGQRRAMFFSGMYGSEVTEVIAAYR